LNGNIDDINIKNLGISSSKLAGNIPTTKLVNPFDINSIIAADNIEFSKIKQSDVFLPTGMIWYNSGLDFRYNPSIFKKTGNQLDIVDSGITGNLLSNAIAGAGLSFDTSTPQALKVNVDSTTISITMIH
jgi:hypothetical protein